MTGTVLDEKQRKAEEKKMQAMFWGWWLVGSDEEKVLVLNTWVYLDVKI
jgi:hypothetical protein